MINASRELEQLGDHGGYKKKKKKLRKLVKIEELETKMMKKRLSKLDRPEQLLEAYCRGVAGYWDCSDCPWDEYEDLDLHNQWNAGRDKSSDEHDEILKKIRTIEAEVTERGKQ